jgi:SAM-dependent methyltransferase
VTANRRTRDVPHPVASRVRNPNAETNTRRRKRAGGDWPELRAHLGGKRGVKSGGKNLGEPRRPAICFLYEDLADPRVPVPVFGMYPVALIPKILPWLKCARREVLHVCSGGLPPGEGIRVDVRPEACPDILADGRHLPLADGSAAAVMLDPPYTEQYARDLYGTDYPVPAHLLAEAARVVRDGGRIVFVHYFTPNPPPGCRWVKSFGLSTGFGFPMRAVTIYEREQRHLFPAERDPAPPHAVGLPQVGRDGSAPSLLKSDASVPPSPSGNPGKEP